MKSKTVAVWLTLILGPSGLHRWYLYRRYGVLGWLSSALTSIGLAGVYRAREFGLDDRLSWLLMPWLGFSIAGCSLLAIHFGLMETQQWNARFNPKVAQSHPVGETRWATVFGLAAALFIGATALLASIAFAFQRFFELQT